MALTSRLSGRPADFLTATILYLVHSNIFISTAATSVAVSTIILADLSFEPLPLFLVFAVTMFVYSLNRVTDLEEDEQNLPGRASFVHRYGKPILAIGVVLYLAAIIVAIQAEIPYAGAMGLPLLMAVLYSLVGLQRILLLKNLLVGISWGLIPLGVGVYYGQLWTFEILFVSGYITAMLTIAAVVFDIKDIEGDNEAGIQTVPIVIGPRWTRLLSAGATVVVAVLVISTIFVRGLPNQYWLLLPFNGYVFGYSLVATRYRTPLFYGFVVDGEHIFLAAILLLYELGTSGSL